VPAPAVIPAPIAYVKVVAVKTLVVAGGLADHCRFRVSRVRPVLFVRGVLGARFALLTPVHPKCSDAYGFAGHKAVEQHRLGPSSSPP